MLRPARWWMENGRRSLRSWGSNRALTTKGTKGHEGNLPRLKAFVTPPALDGLPSRDRAHPNHVPCASGARVHSTTRAARASNAPAPRAIHDARDLPVCSSARVFRLPRGVHGPRGRPGAGIG